MYISDFQRVQSTQELLFLLFASEIGLESVTHPEVQCEALALQFKPLQTILVEKIRAGEESFSLALSSESVPNLPPVPMDYRRDAEVFHRLFTNMNWGQTSASQLLSVHVYPLIGQVVLSNPALKAATLALLKGHIERWGEAVGKRVRESLMKFDLSVLAPSLHPQSVPAPS